MKRIERVNIFFLMLILLQLVSSKVLAFIIKDVMKLTAEQLQNPAILLTILGSNQIVFIFIPVVIYILVTKQSFKEVLKLNKIHIKDVLLTFLIAILFLPVVMALSAVSQLFSHNDVAEVLSSVSQGSILASLVVIAGFPTLFEEFIMRGVVLSEYRGITIKKAAIINGILFAILHLNLQQSLYACAMGILASYLVYYTRTIFASMTLHFTINGVNVLLAWVAFKFQSSGASSAAAAQSDLPEGLTRVMAMVGIIILLLIAAGCLALVVLLVKNIKKRNLDKWKEAENLVEGSEGYRYEDLGIQENLTIEESNKIKKNNSLKEIFNIPFILIIIVYIGAMVYDSLI
ncbi:MAG: lysostaphin resistance A-like protein [Clostridiaceae bacterium]